MVRSLAVALAVTVACPLATQAPPPLVVMLRDQSGAVVRDARGYLRCRPAHQLAALRDLPPAALPFATATEPRCEGRGNDRGELRLVPPDEAAATTAGSGVVWTTAGLGALVVNLQPGRPQRLEMRPMAAVTAARDEPFTLFARALLPGDRTVLLEPLAGTEVRLPAGDYEVWAHAAGGWSWQQLSLASGQTRQLDLTGEPLPLARVEGAALFPVTRPDLDLFLGGDQTVLRGMARRSPLLGVVQHQLRLPSLPPSGWNPGDAPLPWPRLDDEATQRLGPVRHDAPTQGIALHVVRRGDDGTWRRFSTSVAGPGEHGAVFTVPPPPTGDTWLLVQAEGLAPIAAPWHPGFADDLVLPRGAPLHLVARDEQGLPVPDLGLDYVPEGMDAATIEAHSDGRGEAHFGQVVLPGVLRVSDARYANQELRLGDAPGGGIHLTVRAGAELRGRVTWPDGSAAANVLVTLRDPQGRLRPVARAACSDADGRFAFCGLPTAAPLLLFATINRDGHTWSTRRPGSFAGGAELELVVQDEDPRLEPDLR
ncbi:MAG: carboxypeptidase regulatory-like domain-containing protein [Planctomycetes bacterium]|nr:carboxypeptidase regulatory-like domain-containing protein [Planctomycetota bacterium]